MVVGVIINWWLYISSKYSNLNIMLKLIAAYVCLNSKNIVFNLKYYALLLQTKHNTAL